jgi:hypothetical protein
METVALFGCGVTKLGVTEKSYSLSLSQTKPNQKVIPVKYTTNTTLQK